MSDKTFLSCCYSYNRKQELLYFSASNLIQLLIKFYIMKFVNLLALMLLIFSFQTVQAQDVGDFKKERKKLIAITTMDAEQIANLDAIYEKRIADLNLISDLENTDELAFRSKRRAIYKGSENSIRLLMRSDQQEAYRAFSQDIRITRSKKMEKLRKKNASKAELIDAEYGIYNN